jgi:hypothetical protein
LHSIDGHLQGVNVTEVGPVIAKAMSVAAKASSISNCVGSEAEAQLAVGIPDGIRRGTRVKHSSILNHVQGRRLLDGLQLPDDVE